MVPPCPSEPPFTSELPFPLLETTGQSRGPIPTFPYHNKQKSKEQVNIADAILIHHSFSSYKEHFSILSPLNRSFSPFGTVNA